MKHFFSSMFRSWLSGAGVLTLAVAGFGAFPARAANQYWDNGAGGLWSAGANWLSGTPPNSSSDTAIFGEHAIGGTIDIAGGTVALRDLQIKSGDYNIANGTIALYGNVTKSDSGNVIISAGLDLQSGQHVMSPTGGLVQITGTISGAGGIYTNSATNFDITGPNTFTGDFAIRNSTVRIGGSSALGTGNLILGANGKSDSPRIMSVDNSAATLANAATLVRATSTYFGDYNSIRKGEVIFQNDFLFDDTGISPVDTYRNLYIYQTTTFKGAVESASGTGEKTLYLMGVSGAEGMANFEATSSRTGDTYIGTSSNPNMKATIKADNALGTGDIYIHTGTTSTSAGLFLDGGASGITLTNNVTSTWSGTPAYFLTSVSGDNVLSGRVQITTAAGGVLIPVEVTAGSLALSGNVAGGSLVSTNYLVKTGAGTLAISGTVESGISGLQIAGGTLRGQEGVNWSDNVTTGQSLQFLGANAGGLTVLETSGTFTRILTNTRGGVYWGTAASNGSGGFAAFGGNLDIKLNNNTNSLAWNSTSSFLRDGARLILNSPSATHRVDFQNGINLNGAERTVDVFDNTATTNDFARISGVISGTSGSALRKTGAGLLELTNANTYAGGTIVAAGTLLVNNISGSGTGSGTVMVNSGATLGGSGTIAGATTIASGAVLSPGNSPGNLTFGSGFVLAGSYKWELGALSTSNPGVDFDVITVTSGNVDVTGASMNLTLGAYAPTDVAFWQTDQTWKIIDNTGAGTFTGAFAAIDNSAWSSLGAFSTSTVGNDGFLNWTAIPEPATGLLGLTGLSLLIALRRRRS